MKFLVILAAVVLAASAFSDREQWQEFKLKHGKSYRSLVEETRRFIIFKENLRTIEEHNAKYERGETSYTMGVNKFSDMTKAEFKAKLSTRKTERPKADLVMTAAMVNATVADSIDWRDQGAVTEVKDQMNCGSCYAFAATGAMESAYYLKNKKTVSLSEQEIVDCSSDNGGCDGGWAQAAFVYASENGISTEESYPYLGEVQTCQTRTPFITVSSFVQIDADEDSLKAVVGTVGPVAVAIYVDDMMSYAGGIFDEASCINDYYQLDHEVLLVGYGTEDGKDYWLFKNSWGTEWGDSGYAKIARNANNMCGIAADSSYPVL
ncbi:hypothetical protein NQ318_004744 [Aromia moschata]|uniref:Cathepsin L n=1 Tax=Aromia moschata TaxID=1265417 RepID=A0AAV8XYC9_9CUCU|nr:hypothetical protein NQ318_004744 [Aromia moschata]